MVNMIEQRTETIYLQYNPVLSSFCHISKNLYNQANYIVKQGMIDRNWIRYKELDSLLKDNPSYKSLPAQSAQQTLKLLDKNWSSFFASIREWKRDPSKFLGMPRPPKYKHKNGEFALILTNQQCKIRNGIIKLPKKLGNLEIKTRLKQFNQIRILPQGVGYKCEIVYEKEMIDLHLDKERVAAIDLGIDNLITMVNNIGETPIIVKGGIVKSTNQYYNKEKAKIQSFLDKHKLQSSRRLDYMTHKRNLKINDYFHKSSRAIINYCIKNNIGRIIIGYNELWKQESNMGKKNNQKFVNIPYLKLIQQIEYKAAEVGISTEKTEESYTSKCSFLDLEPMEKRNYVGVRVHRGLFKSSNGTLINADCNGAYNIMRKVISLKEIEDVVLHPIRLRINPLSTSNDSI